MPSNVTTNSTNVFDLIVIGSGPAGQKAAVQGAKAGKKVVVIEKGPCLGGGCVHVGTLPSKSFRESVYRYSLSSRGALASEAENYFESKAPPKKAKVELPEMSRLLMRRNRVVEGESLVISDQLKRNGITVIHGTAKFVSACEVEVTSEKGRERITGAYIFIAVGARPVGPKHITIDGRVVHDSDTVLNLKRVPKTMVVLGAGIIGCEYASMFSTGGTKVFLVDRRHEILASVDREIVSNLMDRFSHQNMEIILGGEAKKIDIKPGVDGAPDEAVVYLSNDRIVEAEVVLVAQGRVGNTDSLGLEAVGVECDERGLVKIDKNFRTTVPTIYAVGDVIGAPALASTSMEQGRIACCHAFKLGDESGHAMPALFPYGIYTIPEISMIGRTEEDLTAAKVDFVAGKGRYKELARGQIVGDRWGLLKLMVDRQTLKLLGVHIIGDNAADLIHIGQAVMAFDGDVNYFIHSVFNYPTLAEAYKTAAFHAVNQIRGTTKAR